LLVSVYVGMCEGWFLSRTRIDVILLMFGLYFILASVHCVFCWCLVVSRDLHA